MKSKKSVSKFLLAFVRCVYWLRMRILLWAGELVCGCRTQKVEGSEETPPTRRIAVPSGIRREPWLRSRNETSTRALDYDAPAKVLMMPGGSGETAVLQVERANRRR